MVCFMEEKLVFFDNKYNQACFFFLYQDDEFTIYNGNQQKIR